jgi:hypothetical protein
MVNLLHLMKRYGKNIIFGREKRDKTRKRKERSVKMIKRREKERQKQGK